MRTVINVLCALWIFMAVIRAINNVNAVKEFRKSTDPDAKIEWDFGGGIPREVDEKLKKVYAACTVLSNITTIVLFIMNFLGR